MRYDNTASARHLAEAAGCPYAAAVAESVALVGPGGLVEPAAAPAEHLVAVAEDRASAYWAEKENRSSRSVTRGMVRRLVAVVVAPVGTRIGYCSHSSLGLGIQRSKDSSQAGAARYVVVAVARAAERAAAWTVGSLVAAQGAAVLAAVVASQSVAQNGHAGLDSAGSGSVVAAEVKAHSHYSKASPASALGCV